MYLDLRFLYFCAFFQSIHSKLIQDVIKFPYSVVYYLFRRLFERERILVTKCWNTQITLFAQIWYKRFFSPINPFSEQNWSLLFHPW